MARAYCCTACGYTSRPTWRPSKLTGDRRAHRDRAHHGEARDGEHIVAVPMHDGLKVLLTLGALSAAGALHAAWRALFG
ncbi:hypothetical protein ACPC54_18620 [Kitasatospora sp. NPDC094028]